jgi:hypothetical protein
MSAYGLKSCGLCYGSNMPENQKCPTTVSETRPYRIKKKKSDNFGADTESRAGRGS